jgi:deleted-in-malignant-brain-tumors protein 1
VPCGFGTYKLDLGSEVIPLCQGCPYLSGSAPDSFFCACPDGEGLNSFDDPFRCSPCEAFAVSVGGNGCQACPAGSIPAASQTVCEPCPAGQFSYFSSSPACYPCPAYHTSEIPGATECAFLGCPQGLTQGLGINEYSGSSEVTCSCPSGKTPISIAENVLECVCQPGFVPVSGSDECVACTSGTYLLGDACVPCDDNQTSPPGSTSPDQCEPRLESTGSLARRAALARVGACDRGLTVCMVSGENWEW